MCKCTVRCKDDINYKKGDYLEFSHKGAKYFVCVAEYLNEKELSDRNLNKEFPSHLVGIRIGSQITNQDNCEGDFICGSDSWWSLTDCEVIKNLLTPSQSNSQNK